MRCSITDADDQNKSELLDFLSHAGSVKMFCVGDHQSANATPLSGEYLDNFFHAYYDTKSPWEV